MKKKIIICVCLLLSLLLIPRIGRYTDGGSVSYTSLVYEITKHNSIIGENELMVGYTIDIFGINVYDSTSVVKRGE